MKKARWLLLLLLMGGSCTQEAEIEPTAVFLENAVPLSASHSVRVPLFETADQRTTSGPVPIKYRTAEQ